MREEQQAVTRRLREAHAVHLPRDGGDSCVGVALRLSEGTPAAERERARLASRVAPGELEASLTSIDLARCTTAFAAEAARLGLSEEPGAVRLAFAFDPSGRVCAVVEPSRPELLDPGATPLVDEAARCGKDALFAARFPAGRVEGLDRIVLFAHVPLSVAVEGPPAAHREEETPSADATSPRGASRDEGSAP